MPSEDVGSRAAHAITGGAQALESAVLAAATATQLFQITASACDTFQVLPVGLGQNVMFGSR